VAAWGGLALLMQASYLTRPSRAYQATGEPVAALWTFLPLLALGFVGWQTVGLVKLRRFHRWFAVVFFCWWSAMLVWNGTIALHRPTVKFLPAVIVFSVLVALNLSSAWYLSRRSFREFAAQFVTERDKERRSRMMQKAAQKRVQDEIRSMKS
jgi:hypothetical protein